MATLTGTKIANTYKQLLQVGSSNTGLTGSVQTVQDGQGNNSPLQLSQSAVNIDGTFQLSGVTLTANASTLNAVADLTGATGIVAVSAGNVYGRTITGGTGVSITNGDGTEGNPTIALNTTGVVSGTYGPLTTLEINEVGQIVSATAVSTSVSVPTIRASEFIGGTFKGTTADFSSDTSIGGTAVIEGAATFNSTVSVSGALTGSSATFTGTVSAGDISGANATFSGNISATEYYGDGSNLTGIVAASATFATSAGFAASATNASFALSATNANFAASASFASSASYAASAGEASFAVSASSAAFATSADSATFAVSATNATTAYNVSGGIADISGLTAVSASISDLRATQFYGTSVSIDYLNASDITAITISATDLKSSTLSFTSVSVSSLRVYRLAVETTLSATYGTFTGNVSAVSFYGDGSNLTDLPTAPTSVSAYTVNQLTIVSAATLAGTDLETRINTVSVNTSVNSTAITSINVVVANVSALTSVNAAAITSINTVTDNLATSIGNSNTNIATVSALTSVNLAAITSINVVVANVSALTSVNAAAITSINAVIEGNVSADSGTFNTLTVITSASVGGTLNVGGNVGIGTSSPATQLEVVGIIRSSGTTPVMSVLDTNAGTDEKEWHIKSSNGPLDIQAINDAGVGGGGFLRLTRSTNTVQTLQGYRAAVLRYELSNWDNHLLFSAADSTVGTSSAHALIFDTNNIERMRITSAGNWSVLVRAALIPPTAYLGVVNNIPTNEH
jgi:trimeric autotransporter adhesin